MLKLKNKVTKKQLEKLGFTDNDSEYCYWIFTKRIIIDQKTRLIRFNTPTYEIFDKLFDMFEKGYIEKIDKEPKKIVPNKWELQKRIRIEIEKLKEPYTLEEYSREMVIDMLKGLIKND